jgi:hypothetical protein
MRRSHLTTSCFIRIEDTVRESCWTSAINGLSRRSNSFVPNDLRACCRNCRNEQSRRKLLKTLERETGIEPATSSLGILVLFVYQQLMRTRRTILYIEHHGDQQLTRNPFLK